MLRFQAESPAFPYNEYQSWEYTPSTDVGERAGALLGILINRQCLRHLRLLRVALNLAGLISEYIQLGAHCVGLRSQAGISSVHKSLGAAQAKRFVILSCFWAAHSLPLRG